MFYENKKKIKWRFQNLFSFSSEMKLKPLKKIRSLPDLPKKTSSQLKLKDFVCLYGFFFNRKQTQEMSTFMRAVGRIKQSEWFRTL